VTDTVARYIVAEAPRNTISHNMRVKQKGSESVEQFSHRALAFFLISIMHITAANKLHNSDHNKNVQLNSIIVLYVSYQRNSNGSSN